FLRFISALYVNFEPICPNQGSDSPYFPADFKNIAGPYLLMLPQDQNRAIEEHAMAMREEFFDRYSAIDWQQTFAPATSTLASRFSYSWDRETIASVSMTLFADLSGSAVTSPLNGKAYWLSGNLSLVHELMHAQRTSHEYFLSSRKDEKARIKQQCQVKDSGRILSSDDIAFLESSCEDYVSSVSAAIDEIPTVVQQIINQDIIHKRLNNQPVDALVEYPHRVATTHVPNLNLGMVANFYRSLLNRYGSIDEALSSDDSVKFLARHFSTEPCLVPSTDFDACQQDTKSLCQNSPEPLLCLSENRDHLQTESCRLFLKSHARESSPDHARDIKQLLVQ
ncbi:MAG: hypothetical protein M3Q07_10935, partial [Pseudobdellovibrionaceae bacterium]|nr:hypothetical protein [Pseudobdellovibrionaceae bacterium]